MKYRSLITILLALLVVSVPAQSETYKPFSDDGQVLPWPWGTECPFPWHNIEGMWTESEPRTEFLPVTYFEFEIIDEWASGTRIFRVTHFDEEGNVLAVGRGTASKGYKIVRAVLLPRDKSEESYSVIVRAYREDRFGCSDKLVTVLTMRKAGATPEEDVHMVIGKSNDLED